MPESPTPVVAAPPARGQLPPLGTALSDSALLAGWREGLAVVNLRGDADDPRWAAAVEQALGSAPPRQACSSVSHGALRWVWAGPDDWFVIGPAGQAPALVTALRQALAGLTHAVTDVSGGYCVLQLGGRPVRELLAQGCPLDLHPRAFGPGDAAGSHFFKAALWLWQIDDAPTYELLLRRSFRGYVWLMIERCSAECGLVERRFA